MIVTAARLNKTCGYICRVGDDEFGKSFLEMWHRENVDTSNVIVDADIGSGVDDALGLALALKSKEIQLEAVTAVYGDVDLRTKIG